MSHLFLLLESSLAKAHENSVQPLNSDVNWAFGYSLIEKALENINTVVPNALNDILLLTDKTSDHKGLNICSISSEFQSFSLTIENIIFFLKQLFDAFEETSQHESHIAETGILFYRHIRTLLESSKTFDVNSCEEILAKLKSFLTQTKDSISLLQDENREVFSNDLFRELSEAASQIDAIAAQLKKEQKSVVIDSTLGVTDALTLLMKYATLCQEEIVNSGGKSVNAKYYLKDSKWTEGLISAARTVVSSMAFLGEASKSYSSSNGFEGQVESVLVGAKEVAAGTIQLVTAARVKATNLFSPNQLGLENASKQVASTTSSLASVAKKAYMQQFTMSEEATSRNPEDLEASNSHQLTIAERNQQIEIMGLESKLSQARAKLTLIRKKAYNKN